jgi:hypothetical protein
VGERQSFLDSGDRAPDAFGHVLRTLLTRLREHERELVASDAGHQLARTAHARDGAPDFAQHVISLHVAPSPG